MAPPYRKFALTFGEWNDKTEEQKMEHIRSFLLYIPTIPDLTELSSNATDSPPQKKDKEVNEQELATDSVLSNCTPNNKKPEIPISAEELDISTDKIPKDTLKKIFQQAVDILSDEKGITTAASADPRMQTVKSLTSTTPHIISPSSRNRDLLECKCKTHTWFLICEHTIAVAVNLNMCFAYFVQVKKKIMQSKARRGLTAAIETDLTIGLKKDQIKKHHAKKKTQESSQDDQRKRFLDSHIQQYSTNAAVINNPTTPTPQSAPLTPHPSSQYANNVNNSSNNQLNVLLSSPPPTALQSLRPHSSSNAALSQIIKNFSHINNWQSEMSPFFYEIVLLPGNVSVCYGCHKKFEVECRTFPNNVIVKHMDRRITGVSPSGPVTFANDFTATYYHLDVQHIAIKTGYSSKTR